MAGSQVSVSLLSIYAPFLLQRLHNYVVYFSASCCFAFCIPVLLLRVMIESLNLYLLHSVNFPPSLLFLPIHIIRTYILSELMMFMNEVSVVTNEHCRCPLIRQTSSYLHIKSRNANWWQGFHLRALLVYWLIKMHIQSHRMCCLL